MHIKHARGGPGHPSAMRKRFLGFPRVAAMAIILVAAALVLLRPLCESWGAGTTSHASGLEHAAMSTVVADAHTDGTSDDACCSFGDTGVVSSVRDMNFGGSGDFPSPVPPLVAAAFIVLSVVAPPVFRRRSPPRTPQSYYLRSARILR